MKQFKILIVGLISCIFSIVVVNASPVHTEFDDDNFYKCVVKSYNQDNNATKNFETDILTDSELGQIKNLMCHFTETDDLEDTTYDMYRVKSTKGLDKLVNVEAISFWGNGIASLDVSGNKKLKIIDLTREKISTIDLANNSDLEYISIDITPISAIDIKSNNKLVSLSLIETNIKELDLTNNVALETLRIEGTSIKNLNLSENTNLKNLLITSVPISTIDLTKNTKLEALAIKNIDIKNLDLSKNINLKVLSITSAPISAIDLSNLTELEELYINRTSIKDLNLNKNLNLKEIDILKNCLLSIDVSKLNYLAFISAGTQERSVSAVYKDNKYQINLKDYDKNIDPNKIIIEENDNIKYNKETGVITLNDLVEDIKYEYEINDNNSMYVTLLLNKKGAIKLNLLDSADNKVKDAVVGLYNSNKELIQKVETNEDGIATFEYFDLGSYYIHIESVPEKYKLNDEWFEISLDKDNYDFNAKLEFNNADEKTDNPKTGFNEMLLAFAVVTGGVLIVLKRKSKKVKIAKI